MCGYMVINVSICTTCVNLIVCAGSVWVLVCVWVQCVCVCLCCLAVYGIARPYGALSGEHTTHLAPPLALVLSPSVLPRSLLKFIFCSVFYFFNFLLQLGFISLTLLHCSTLGALSHLKNNPLPPKKSSLGICLFISVCLYVSVCEPE